MLGLVSCTKHSAAKGSSYFVVCIAESGIEVHQVGSRIKVDPGEVVKFENEIIESVADDGLAAKIFRRIDSEIKKSIDNDPFEWGNAEVDATTGKMWGSITSASGMLLRKLMKGIPIIIRFHNDADGSGGALSLYTAISDFCSKRSIESNAVWIMQKGVAYNSYDSGNDILIANNYTGIERPLLLMVDFGTTTESNAGIDAVKEKFDIIWLDHHPVVEGFEGVELENYINPWLSGADSNYTAGLLAAIFSKSFSKADTSQFEQASLIGDYSGYANADDSRYADLSMLLDFITSDLGSVYGPAKSNVTPQEMISVIENKERMSELLSYANIKLEEAIDRGLASLRNYSSDNANIYSLDFDDVRLEGAKYPLPGRFSSKLLAKLGESGVRRVVVVVHVGAYIMIRTDKDLCRDIDLQEIIGEVKERHRELVENGGGHRCAGAVKLRDKDARKEVVSDIIGMIKKHSE